MARGKYCPNRCQLVSAFFPILKSSHCQRDTLTSMMPNTSLNRTTRPQFMTAGQVQHLDSPRDTMSARIISNQIPSSQEILPVQNCLHPQTDISRCLGEQLGWLPQNPEIHRLSPLYFEPPCLRPHFLSRHFLIPALLKLGLAELQGSFHLLLWKSSTSGRQSVGTIQCH